MPTATYIALANTTLSSTASSVTFSSIPATYRDLVVVINCRVSTTSDFIKMGFNNNAASMNIVYAFGTGSGGGTSGSGSNLSSPQIVGDPSDEWGVFTYNIMDYSATDKFKTVLGRSNAADHLVLMNAFTYNTTSAITQINLSTNAANWVSGSTFALYGIVS